MVIQHAQCQYRGICSAMIQAWICTKMVLFHEKGPKLDASGLGIKFRTDYGRMWGAAANALNEQVGVLPTVASV
jgi:hypothetical protein